VGGGGGGRGYMMLSVQPGLNRACKEHTEEQGRRCVCYGFPQHFGATGAVVENIQLNSGRATLLEESFYTKRLTEAIFLLLISC